MKTFAMHGYQVRTPLELHLPVVPQESTEQTALTVALGPSLSVEADAPPGEIIAEFIDDVGGRYYSFARDDERVRLRFHRTADFVGDPGLRNVVVNLDHRADPSLAPVLVCGAVIATRLLLDGHLVLHASAVQVGSGAVAFVGMSGMGKSTMAALCLAAGHALITDDVLRVQTRSSLPPLIWPGSAEVRLRPSATSILERIRLDRRQTADGRTAIASGAAFSAPVPLLSCVVPKPDRGLRVPVIRRLAPFEAVSLLLRFPRVVGWQEPVTTTQQLQHLADLCESTPVVEARLPWGPPFNESMVPHLFDALAKELG